MTEIRFSNKPGEYHGVSWGRIEYALFDKSHLCPRARYVGGTSNYLCECSNPHTCPGVIAVVREYYPEQITED